MGFSEAVLASPATRAEKREAFPWTQSCPDPQTRANPGEISFDWLYLSNLGTLTLEVVLGIWAGDTIPCVARRLGVSISTVRRRLKDFRTWVDSSEASLPWAHSPSGC